MKRINFFKVLSSLLLAIIVVVLFFLIMIRFNVISLSSSQMPEAITLNQTEIGIKVKENYQLTANILPNGVYYGKVIWSSSDTNVAIVNADTGYVTALKAGTASITAKTNIGQLVAECLVNVSNKDISITSINITNSLVNLLVGNKYTLTYSVAPNNATTHNLSYYSSDTSIATVDAKGQVTAIKAGKAVITLSVKNTTLKDTVVINVYNKSSSSSGSSNDSNKDNLPTQISLSKSDIELVVGGSNTIKATVTPSSANQSVTWTSSNSQVATVDSNGQVTAISIGKTIIVATSINGITSSVNVTVQSGKIVLTDINILQEVMSIELGQTKKIGVIFTPNNATNQGLTWASSNTNILTVDGSGNIVPVSKGSVIVTATSIEGKHSDYITVEVVEPANIIPETSITFSTNNYRIFVNDTVNLVPVILPSNVTYQSVIWSSSNRDVANVDNGLVYGLSAGTAIITATTRYSGLTAKVTIIVDKVEVSGMTLNVTSKELNIGETFVVVADILPVNATDKNISWSTSDKNIAVVSDDGIITAINSGKAYVTAITRNKIEAKVLIEVK